MSRRGGFALAAVLAAVVIMAMVVAVGAQRALVGAREGALAVRRAEMSVAIAAAVAAVLAAPAGGADQPFTVPGALFDSGTTVVGSARATWRVTGAAFPYASAEIDVQGPVFQGMAHERRRLLVRLAPDSASASMSGARWVPAGSGWWAQIPVP